MDTKRLDLNLLQALDALLAERNVTKAALRLSISQPALSAQLARLREELGDPLLTPVQRGMMPTARALELQKPLRDALDQLQAVMAKAETFNPAKAKLTVSIAASDYIQSALLIPFLVQLRQTAPSIRVALRRLDGNLLEKEMERGEVDLAVMVPDNAPPNLRSRHLFDETMVCVVRKGHPKVGRKLTLELMTSLEHILLSPRGGSFTGSVDDALAAHGEKRKVAISASSFLWLLDMVRNSDMMAIAPASLVKRQAEGLSVFAPPIAVPGFGISMLWHERTHMHKAHSWVRNQLLNSC